MITPEQHAEIRRLYFGEHWKIGTIVAQLGVHPDTVRAAVAVDGRVVRRGACRRSILDPYLPFVRETLAQYPRLRTTRLYAMLRPRDRPASSTRGRDRRRYRSQRGDDSDGRFSGEAGGPRGRSSGALRLDIQAKPWHKRDDGLGVLEPEGVTRVRRFSPGPHPRSHSAYAIAHPSHAAKRPWTGPRPWTHRTRPPPLGNLARNARFPHRPPPSSFPGSIDRIGKTRRETSTFLRFYVAGDN